MPKTRSNAGQSGVRALVRGLAVLREVNLLGEARPGEIATRLGLPRPTVYRLLQTLEEEGFVVFSSTNNRVRVTRYAASLGDGSAAMSAICQAAGPLFSEYLPKIVWPLDLSVYESAAMVIQETTHGRSPLSVDRGMIGYRMPVLRTSAGRAYLAFISDEERRLVVEHIRRLAVPEDLSFLEAIDLNDLLADIRARGYAIREAGEFRPNTSSIAVPVKLDGVTTACVSIIWIRSALSIKEATTRYVEPLMEIAERLAAAVGTEQRASA
ncbi:DNA-binding transcriptional regulator [Rhizobium sp. P32RR-XVIII]|uniref:DNA-binding transcriptional regulator n=1 Tax=Rhizobium sp. P32RR-XVIII TaxID=2726738 RepID=UPI001456823F|nr:DNA-binding transcriptional regulator [Rhizobium sp. P32RR-XVIII]NLS06291.1 DNA-binding transcriptional regulator [Rhizobium sp. P32RR-XVIII]